MKAKAKRPAPIPVPEDLLTSRALQPALLGGTGLPEAADSLAYDPVQRLLAVGLSYSALAPSHHVASFALSKARPVCSNQQEGQHWTAGGLQAPHSLACCLLRVPLRLSGKLMLQSWPGSLLEQNDSNTTCHELISSPWH